MSELLCQFSQDTGTEIRRRVRKSRETCGYLAQSPSHADLVEHDSRIILEFLHEEFQAFLAELFSRRVEVPDWTDLHTWEYPGECLAPMTQAVSEFLGGENSAWLFSNSGHYTVFLVCRKVADNIE